MREIGIMGGTFDPIHIGHLLLGQFAYEQFSLDEIWFLPNYTPPHKTEKFALENDFANRVEMIRLAISDTKYFRLCMAESEPGKVYFSYETMERLKAVHPDVRFYFIIGADSLYNIESWKCVDRLFASCTILAAQRDDMDEGRLIMQISRITGLYKADIRLLKAPLIEISSTTLRERINKGLSVRYFIPDGVIAYIKDRQLYKEEV